MILIVGGGPAGRIAAVRLASAGREVTLVEGGGLGGQCLHYGCMVVCALNDVARVLHNNRELHRQGIIDSVPSPDLAAIWTGISAIQGKIENVLREETRSAGVTIIQGKKAKINGRSVTIGSETLVPDTVIIATGSRPRIPAIPGMDLPGIFHAHSLHTLDHVPKTIAIIGCGAMAAEWAYIFRELGSEVHLVCRSRFLRSEDPHLRSQARRELSGVFIHEGAAITEIRRSKNGIAVIFDQDEGKSVIGADTVLVAAGLAPASEDVTGVEMGPDGEIITDSLMRTSVEGVYACGDVTGPPCLTPVARRQGMVAAAHILGEPSPGMPAIIPHAIHLKNEIASASSRAGSFPDTGDYVMPGPAGPGTFWWVPGGLTGIAKISVENGAGIISGVFAGGPSAGTIVQYMAYLMERRICVSDLAGMMEIHPSTDGIYGLARYSAESGKKKNDNGTSGS